MKKIVQRFPPGWNEKKVRAVIDYYDRQTDHEGAAEIEEAAELPGKTWMAVPTDMVPEISRLIKAKQRKAPRSRRRKAPRAKTR